MSMINEKHSQKPSDTGDVEEGSARSPEAQHIEEREAHQDPSVESSALDEQDDFSVTGPTHAVPSSRAMDFRRRDVSTDGELAPNDIAGDYVIQQKIGWGGCSTVYAAAHRATGQPVAVKVMHAGLADSPRQVQRFAQEAQAVRLIQHPSIVEIRDIGRLADGRPYIVMELLRGVNLASLLRTRGRFSPRQALELLQPVSESLTMAHEAGIIHRDIKASNIVLATDDDGTQRVKLLDFGIAKLATGAGGGAMQTTVGHVLGTPHSMAPEQIRGLPVDGRTDIYALGALLFRLLTGKHPFEGCDAIALTRMHIETPPPAPSQLAPVSPAVDAVVRKAMEKDPARRYQTVRELIEALHQAVDARSTSAETTAQALGIYVEVRVPEDEEPDDEVIDDLMSVLDIAEHMLREQGCAVPLITSNAVLGTLLAPAGEVEAWRARAADTASALARAIAGRVDADQRVRVNVCVHQDDAVVRPGRGGLEIVGGAIVDVGSWAPTYDLDGVCATPEALGRPRTRDDHRSYVRIGVGSGSGSGVGSGSPE